MQLSYSTPGLSHCALLRGRLLLPVSRQYLGHAALELGSLIRRASPFVTECYRLEELHFACVFRSVLRAGLPRVVWSCVTLLS